MPSTPSRPMRLLVEGTKVVVVGVVSFLAVAPALTTQRVTAEQSTAPDAAQAALVERVDTLMTRHDCSHTGFGPDVIPGSAIVERGSQVLHVSFDDGWAVYTGDATGTLIALCRTVV